MCHCTKDKPDCETGKLLFLRAEGKDNLFWGKSPDELSNSEKADRVTNLYSEAQRAREAYSKHCQEGK